MKAMYICGPMSDLEDKNYPAFNAASDRLRDRGWDVLNPVDLEVHNTSGKPQSWQWYMRHSIRMLALADAVALLPGWGQSRGAIIEYQVGAGLRLPMRSLQGWLEWSP